MVNDYGDNQYFKRKISGIIRRQSGRSSRFANNTHLLSCKNNSKRMIFSGLKHPET